MIQRAKNTPAKKEMQETGVRSLSREFPLEEEMAIHSIIPAWEIPWTEKPGGLHSMGLQRAKTERARTALRSLADPTKGVSAFFLHTPLCPLLQRRS